MSVGEQHGLDVMEGPARSAQMFLQLGEVSGQPGVDEDQAVGVIDQVEVDDVVAEAVDAGSDLTGRGVRSGTAHGPSSGGHGKVFDTVNCNGL
jgi:hypothetical protein